MEKTTKIGIGMFVVIVAVGLFITQSGSITGNALAIEAEGLSGQILPTDPAREMAGTPCHYMGGGYMGDCNTREINLEAWQYDWSEPTITVRTGELIRIKATSKDVAHGIAIPQLNFNMRIEPGKTTVGEFMAPAPGEYTYGCSVMCGPGHHNHYGKLIVLP